LYILINKNNITRFFKTTNEDGINPKEGIVVQTDIVYNDSETLFDFYMVANKNPATASARPVHYEVVINTTNMTRDEII